MIPTNLYHIFNRGNNSGKIFFSTENYLFFLGKIKRHLKSHLDILAYCLMPNHYHMMVSTKRNFEKNSFSKDLRIMLSSYTRAINRQNHSTGSLFQQNTKIKALEEGGNSSDYPLTCFHYIHQNPVKAKLVRRFEDWEMSSFNEYLGISKDPICNMDLARQYLDIPETPELFIEHAYQIQIIKGLNLE